MEREEKFSGWGLYTLMASLVVIFLITRRMGIGYMATINDIIGFWTSNVITLPKYENLVLRIGAIGSILLVSLILNLILICILRATLGTRESEVLNTFLPPGFHISRMMFVVVLEELFARKLFVGILPQFLPGPLQLYALLGNILWTAIHIFNYKKKDRNPLLVLPQLLGGFFLIYIYARWGFFWVILAHFSFNAIIMTILKRADGLTDDIIYGVWYLFVLAIFAFFTWKLDLSLTFLAPWINQEIIPLQGQYFQFDFWDYFVLFVLLEAATEVVLSILSYDPAAMDEETFETLGLRNQIIGGTILTGFIYLAVFTGQRLGATTAQIAIGVTIVLSLTAQTDSLSAMGRSWFKNIIVNYVLVCTILVLGFWRILGMFFLFFWLDLIPWAIRRQIAAN